MTDENKAQSQAPYVFPSSKLRWNDKGGMRPVLQELVGVENGEEVWKDIPTVITTKHNPNKV